MKKILLLGGFGFIGTNILKFIDENFEADFKVVVFDRFKEHPKNVKFECVEEVFDGDFSDTDLLRKIFVKHNFDLTIHSISSTVPATSQNIRYDIESNLIPTIDLLNLLIEFDNKNIIYISSGGAVYGQSILNHKHKENDNTMPLSSYGVVKLAIEKYLYQYQHHYGLNSLILRLANPYGPYHFSTKQGVINVALRAAIEKKDFTVWGDGTAQKDYIFIEDFCKILLQLVENSVTNRTLNIGSGKTISIMEILDKILNICPDFKWEYVAEENFDVTHFELDISELNKVIPNLSFTSFEAGVEKTHLWLDKQL
ncbi:MAG: NAD-dependent epimerase/dehydratase family protein [Paludibacter sp.]|nr:NAD-dependent epimerase/dehydratase family protein [Paludibacter sp.]